MLLGKSLKKYYKHYILLIIVGILALIAVDWFQLYIPELLGKIVDLFEPNYVADNILKDIYVISTEVILIALILFGGRIAFRASLFRVSTGVAFGLRQEMFEKAERLDVEYYHNVKTGTLMSWVTQDTEEIQEYFGWGTVMLIDGIFLTILCIIKMLLLDWVMSLLIFIPVALIVVWGLIVEKYMSMKYLDRQKALDKMYDFTDENFAGIRVIKAFIKETQQLLRFSKIARKNEKADITLGMYGVGFDICIEIIIALVTALIIGFGGYFVYVSVTSNGFTLFGHRINLDASTLVVFFSYFTNLVWPLIALGQVITMHSRAKTSLKRVEDFLNTPEVIKDAKNAKELKDVKGDIEFKHLSFTYPGKSKNYLYDLSFKINAGETIGIVGRIGSGKTTILNLLSRLYNVAEGSLFIDDKDIMKCTTKSVREAIAVVPQENFLFSDTIENNIKFGNKDAKFPLIEAGAEFSEIKKDIDGFEKKFDTLTGERGVSLSGGQKQRIAIARAYVKKAPIMILDDSVSAVDIKTEEEILENISLLRKGKTTIVIASRISTVNKMDKILVLDEGKLEAFDTPENLLKISPTYKKMVYLQKLEDELKEGK